MPNDETNGNDKTEIPVSVDAIERSEVLIDETLAANSPASSLSAWNSDIEHKTEETSRVKTVRDTIF